MWPFNIYKRTSSSPKYASLVEIGPVVLEKKIYQFRQFIFPLLSLSLFEEGRGPSFEKILIPFTQGCFVLSLVEICPVLE